MSIYNFVNIANRVQVYKMSFYERFIKLCKNNMVAPSKVVADIGLNKSNVTYWKNGSIPKLSTIKKLSAYFDVSMDYFLDINSLPPRKIYFGGSDPKTVSIPEENQVKWACDTFLKEIGFLQFLNTDELKEKGSSDTVLVFDSRSNQFYIANLAALDSLRHDIVSYSKYQMATVLSESKVLEDIPKELDKFVQELTTQPTDEPKDIDEEN